MDKRKRISLTLGQSAEVEGLKITFMGGTTVHYNTDREPQGALAFDLEFDGELEMMNEVEYDWGKPREVFGFTLTVVNKPEKLPRSLELEVQPPR